MGRKAFGPTKRKACDTKHCKKKKKEPLGGSAAAGTNPHERFFKVILFVFFVSGLLFAQGTCSYAQEQRVIKFKDGTTIIGKVLSKENNVYKIENSALGVVVVKDSDIQSIGEATPSLQSPAIQGSMAGIQQKITNDPKVIESIQSLTKDSEVLEILADPQLKDAIMRQDIDYLKNNEKFIKFTNNPAVKKIIADVTPGGEKSQQQ